MSFSSEVRKELCECVSPARHCMLAELSAIIHTTGCVADGGLHLESEHVAVARKILRLLQDIFNIEGETTSHGHSHQITIAAEQTERVMKACGNALVVMSQCCKRSFIRGAFCTSGTLSNPQKTYHMEFVLTPSSNTLSTNELTALLNSFGLRPRTTQRKAYRVLYIKEAESIVDLLNVMEAHRSLLRFENIRIEKEMRNSVNRKVNFETANLTKTVNAAVSQTDDIHYIAEHAGLEYLSPQLAEAARLRLDYSDASLREIGLMMSPPIGKSGVNHRLRKISDIAGTLRSK